MNSRTSNLYLGNPNPSATNENLAVAGSSVSFAALNIDTDYVIIDVQDNDVYVTFDGTTPSGQQLSTELSLLTNEKHRLQHNKRRSETCSGWV
jgi:hypothetical protein